MTTKFFDDDELVAFIKEPSAEDTKKALASMRALIAERDDLIKERDEALEKADALEDAATSALETVRYWFHDVLILNKPMTPPRRILVILERAMGLA